jgi:hypothetical protein
MPSNLYAPLLSWATNIPIDDNTALASIQYLSYELPSSKINSFYYFISAGDFLLNVSS